MRRTETHKTELVLHSIFVIWLCYVYCTISTLCVCVFQVIPWEEIWYFPTAAAKYTRKDTTSDRMSLKGEVQPDSELLSSLTSDTGPLAAGAMPALDMTPEGQKSMCESLAGKDGSVAKIKIKKNKTDEATEVVPSSPKETLGHNSMYKVKLSMASSTLLTFFQPKGPTSG